MLVDIVELRWILMPGICFVIEIARVRGYVLIICTFRRANF